MPNRTIADLFFMIFVGTDNFELLFNVPDVLSVPASGDAEMAVEALTTTHYIAKQLNEIGTDGIREFLSHYGAWDENELADDAENRRRAVWLAACGLREELVEAGALDFVQTPIKE